MRYLLAILAFLASLCAGAVNPDTNATLFRCAVALPSALWFIKTSEMANSTNKAAQEAATDYIAVNVYIHVVTSKGEENSVTNQMIEDQMTVLNQDYDYLGITFSLSETSWWLNDDWAVGDDLGSMKLAIRKGTYADLNLYVLSNYADTGLLGYCNFPTSTNSNDDVFFQDGCVVASGTLPGGNLAPYNEGGTSTHEVGHWFGLLHAFQGEECAGNGDYVADTPMQKIATQGCPKNQDSCPDAIGLDDIDTISPLF